METGFLEDWLQRAAFTSSTASGLSSSSTSRPSSPSAQQIAQAWSQIRECVQNGVLQPQDSAALGFLREYGRTIHMVEPQARLLLSIISSVTSSHDVEELTLAQARSSAASLLSIWLRRGAAAGRASRASSTHFAEIVEAVISNTLKALGSSSHKTGFVSEAILLLGTVCVNPHVQEDQRRICQEAIARECVRQRSCINGATCKEALAGVGYAMAFSSGRTLKALLQAVLFLWADNEGLCGVPTPRVSLENGLFILHLMEWYTSFLGSQQQHAASLTLVVEEIVEASTAVPARCAVMMSAAGLLRSFHVRQLAKRPTTESTESSWESMAQLLKATIIRMVDDTAQLQVEKIRDAVQEGTLVDAAVVENENFITAGQLRDKHWFQCVALAISRCAGFPPSLSVLVCLTTTLLEDILPLSAYYNGIMSHTSGQDGEVLSMHVGTALFHEAGAIFRVICEQYQSADIGWQGRIENLFSQYSHHIYAQHRCFLARMDGRKNDTLNSTLSANDTGALRKILEAVLLSVVMLFSLASKQRIDTDMYAKGRFAAQVMHSLSCIEFIRQGQVPEYKELVQRCVAWALASEATCAMLVSMFPSYDKIIHPPGPALSSYSWMKDDVQDCRVLFGFRVLPSCLHTFPTASFSNEVAPTMFLYMKHPNQALVQASHSLLVSFLSTKSKDAERYSESDRDIIKEQLAVGFIERTFEEFQSFSHYDVFVTVVGAIARQLPAGSTATRGCITALSRRASELFSCASMGECNDKGADNRLETGKKLQTLLLHLILIADVQVLPHLLQEVARLVLGQTNPHRMYALEEAFDILAGSDDLTRKHILVPWLQSLSYLCSNFHEQGRSPSKRHSRNGKGRSRSGFNNEVGQGDGELAFNPSSATMFVESEADGDTSQISTSRL